MSRLSRSASGLRHLRWGREVLGTLKAHAEINPELTGEERDAVRREIEGLAAAVDALSGAVKPYRDFLERSRTLLRGRQRVVTYLCDEAIREAVHREALVAEATMRRPLNAALQEAITALREHLEQMDKRLGERFHQRFIASLYPALARGGTRVADADDPDDDATAPADALPE